MADSESRLDQATRLRFRIETAGTSLSQDVLAEDRLDLPPLTTDGLLVRDALWGWRRRQGVAMDRPLAAGATGNSEDVFGAHAVDSLAGGCLPLNRRRVVTDMLPALCARVSGDASTARPLQAVEGLLIGCTDAASAVGRAAESSAVLSARFAASSAVRRIISARQARARCAFCRPLSARSRARLTSGETMPMKVKSSRIGELQVEGREGRGESSREGPAGPGETMREYS